MKWFSIGFIIVLNVRYFWTGINCNLIPFHTDHVSIWRSNFLYNWANFYPYIFASQQIKFSFIFNVYSYHFHCNRDQMKTVTNTFHYLGIIRKIWLYFLPEFPVTYIQLNYSKISHIIPSISQNLLMLWMQKTFPWFSGFFLNLMCIDNKDL